MGRATEFFDYINRESDNFKNADGSWKTHYYHIDFTEELKKCRREYRKGLQDAE